MNATEARNLSNNNIPKLVDQYVKETINTLNQKVKAAANEGQFGTSVYIDLPKTYLDAVINRLEEHYKSIGYEVNVRNFFLSKMFMVSWQK